MYVGACDVFLPAHMPTCQDFLLLAHLALAYFLAYTHAIEILALALALVVVVVNPQAHPGFRTLPQKPQIPCDFDKR